MRISEYLLSTLKNIPQHCETISHQLMLRAGLVRQISSGLYIWLPTGLRVLKKIENLIRKEMNKIGAIEISMPMVQPARLWHQSGRWAEYGAELLRFKNRNNQDYILSPTHEEMISELIHKEIMPYHKEFPLNVYQINTKYRDEMRPCFGVIRAREFIMKDGYSFHINQKSLQNTYNTMYDTYCTIFNKFSLNFCINQVDPGKMGGILSHEFQAYSKHQENNIFISHTDKILKNDKNITTNTLSIQKNVTSALIAMNSCIQTNNTKQLIYAPYIHSVEELIIKFNLSVKKMVKTIIVHTDNQHHNIYTQKFFGLVIRADHQLNHKKTECIPNISIPLSFANLKEMSQIAQEIEPNLLGAINLPIPLIIDYNVAKMHNFIAGSNINGKYFININWNKNLSYEKITDLCEENNHNHLNTKKINKVSLYKCVEIGHIFQLGQKYSNVMHHKNYPNIHKHTQKKLILNMGCYGIGITRIIAIIIEQHHDKNGIIWPDIIAPFKIAIIPINMYHSVNVQNTTKKIYDQLLSCIGTDILIDDRKERPGVMFADIDLIGIPHILIISDRNLINQEIEYKNRRTGIVTKVKINILLKFLIKKLSN